MSVVEFRAVKKRFVIHHNPTQTLKERVLRFCSLRAAETPESFWALNGINLQIQQGESIALIGQNGSGKSTLLYLVAGTMMPTEGEVLVRGRVAPLIELGVGFHPELTGKENVYLNASLYGLRRSDIDAKFSEIVKFSEMERFIDAPVKTYSSGMYMRLGFSIAVHLDPDILLIDEVLTVGDEAFQRKCLDKLRALRVHGKTILFVSHDPRLVAELCDRACLLKDGEIVQEGEADDVVAEYHGQGAAVI